MRIKSLLPMFFILLVIMTLQVSTVTVFAGPLNVNQPKREVSQTKAGITLLMPSNGSPLETGVLTPVAWQYTGIAHTSRVTLQLFKGPAKLGDIATNIPISQPPLTPGYGALTNKWKVGTYAGGSAPVDCGYRIRVGVTGTDVLNDFSDIPFCISNPIQKSLKLTSPQNGDNWLNGSSHKISWACTGCAGQLRINLLKGGQLWGVIAKPDAAAGFYEWKVGEMPLGFNTHEFTTANDYRITIASQNNELKDENTPYFSISTPSKPVKINTPSEKWLKVTSPMNAAVWHRTQNQEITWQMSESMTKEFARILLLKGGQKVIEIEDHRPLQNGIHTWTLPGVAVLPTGSDYQIRIQCIKYPAVLADSAAFQIVATPVFSNPVFPASIKTGYYRFNSDGKHEKSLYSDTTDQSDVVKIGYRNSCKDSLHASQVFRSFVRFDLKNLKGTVKWAKFSYQKNDGTPDGPKHLWAFKLPWNGSAYDMWNSPLTEINPMNLEQMRALVQGWIDDPTLNFGLLMTGPESIACNNNGNIMNLGNVKLDVGIDTIE